MVRRIAAHSLPSGHYFTQALTNGPRVWVTTVSKGGETRSYGTGSFASSETGGGAEPCWERSRLGSSVVIRSAPLRFVRPEGPPREPGRGRARCLKEYLRSAYRDVLARRALGLGGAGHRLGPWCFTTRSSHFSAAARAEVSICQPSRSDRCGPVQERPSTSGGSPGKGQSSRSLREASLEAARRREERPPLLHISSLPLEGHQSFRPTRGCW